MAYSTASNITALTGFAISDSTSPTTTQVNTYITWADAWIDNYIQKSYTSTTVTELYDITEGKIDPITGEETYQDTLFLKNKPIVSIATLKEDVSADGEAASWETRTEGRANDYIIYKNEGYVKFLDNLPSNGHQKISVNYTYGATSAPANVTFISTCIAGLLTLLHKAGVANPTGVMSYSIGNKRITWGIGTVRELGTYYGQSQTITTLLNMYLQEVSIRPLIGASRSIDERKQIKSWE